MKRDSLFTNGFMRLAAYTLMTFVCIGAGDVWGESISPPSQKWIKWRKENSLTVERLVDAKNKVSSVRRLSSDVPEEMPTGEEPTIIDFDFLSMPRSSLPRGL